MTKNAFTTIAAILLILYALTNFGASLGQFGKGKMISGSANLASSMGNMAGDAQNAQSSKNLLKFQKRLNPDNSRPGAFGCHPA